ncbi:MAG: ArnT family glycosyltransferase [Planctomycetota bacterium]|jgi:hypothetical protein
MFQPLLGEGLGLVLIFPAAILYALLLTGAGLAVVGRWTADRGLFGLLLGFVVGSAFVALPLLLLALSGALTGWAVGGLVAGLGVLACLAGRNLWFTLHGSVDELKAALFSAPRWNTLFAIIFFCLLITYALLAGTPARSGDAMRYFLAQTLELVEYEALLVRPYYHYSFPLYYQLTGLPLFLLAGGMGMKWISLTFFLGTAAALICLARRLGIVHIRWMVLTLLLIPIAYQEATIVTNDWCLCFYLMAAVLFIGQESADLRPVHLAVSMVSVGMALGVKYQAFLFLPWIGLLFLVRVASMAKPVRYGGVAILLAVLVASPFYLRNLWIWGNPIWPMMIGLFDSGDSYLTQIAAGYNRGFSGVRSATTYWQSVQGMLRYPIIPALVWLVSLPGLLLIRDRALWLRLGLGSAVLIWAILQPTLYPRFLVYFLPFVLLGLGRGLDAWKRDLAPIRYWTLRAGQVVLLLYGMGLGGYYAKGLLAYYVDRNLDAYHWATNYYSVQAWAQKNLPEDSRVLAILRSGHTYYLRKEYLRADPSMSGLIDWRREWTSASFAAEMKRLGITHILVDDSYWRRERYPAASELPAALQQAGYAKVLREWKDYRVVFSRFSGDSMHTRVVLYALTGRKGTVQPIHDEVPEE